MEISTPINTKANNLRRRTLIKAAESSVPFETVIDDDAERSTRRSILETQKKNQEVSGSSLNESFRFSGEDEMKDHLKICTKLYAENKITTGVAWQLRIIDLLRAIARNKNTDSLQVAGNSLDIGAKVYSLRVDDVHAEALKLANSMARFAEKNQDQENVEEDANAEKEVAKGPKKKKKTFRFDGVVKNTIAKDRQSLLAPIPQLESVFFSNRIDSTLSTVDNLFTNSVPMDKSCSKLLVLGTEKAWVTGPDAAVEDLESPKNLDIDLLPTKGSICKPFENLILDQWNEDGEETYNATKDGLTNDVVVFDDKGIPMHELDGSLHHDFRDDDYASDHEEDVFREDQLAQQIQGDIPRVVSIFDANSTVQRSEYSYNTLITLPNGKVVDKIWAGPSHWKVKFIKRDRGRYTGAKMGDSMKKKKNLKKKNEPQPLDLEELENVEEELLKMKKIKIKKRTIATNKYTCPLPDLSIKKMMETLDELMIKPGVKVIHMLNDPASNIENNEENNQENSLYDDHNDVFLDPMDTEDHMTNNDIESEEIVRCNQERFMGDNLVDAPEYVAKTYIPYALQAKKMDMKKLKNYVWQMLANNTDVASKVAQTTFSKIYENAKSTLPTSMAKELSCSLAFSAILHLCNEKNLKLTQLSGCKDFKIESDNGTKV